MKYDKGGRLLLSDMHVTAVALLSNLLLDSFNIAFALGLGSDGGGVKRAHSLDQHEQNLGAYLISLHTQKNPLQLQTYTPKKDTKSLYDPHDVSSTHHRKIIPGRRYGVQVTTAALTDDRGSGTADIPTYLDYQDDETAIPVDAGSRKTIRDGND